MRRRICGICELRRDKSVAVTGFEPFRHFDTAAHTFRLWRKDDFRAVRFQNFYSFDAHIFGHCENKFHFKSGAYHGKSYAGIAGSRLDNNGVFVDCARRRRFQNHVISGAVFHAARRIEIFQLPKDVHVVVTYAVEFHKRGFPDCFQNIVV